MRRAARPPLIATLALVAATISSPAHAALSYTCNAPHVAQSFAAGSLQSYVVPAGVTSVVIDAAGAQGGASTAAGAGVGGRGAEVAATVAVNPGDTLCVLVGSAGSNGTLSGSGGGGSFVFTKGAGTCAASLASVGTGGPAPELLVAAAGGGGGGITAPNAGLPGRATGLGAGSAGALAGSNGNSGAGGAGGTGGNGGAAGTGGGGGGGLLTNGATSAVPCQGGQSLRNGAAGGASCVSGTIGPGGFGGGGTAGGGGGYNGGGGTADNPAGAGGGGSFSAVAPIAAHTLDAQQAGSGAVSMCALMPLPAVSTQSIPTLSSWALALLAALMGLVAAGRMRRTK